MKTIELPTEIDETLLEMLRAVANPMRYRILQILAESGESHCGTLGDQLPIAASTLSQHLKVLREAGLIQGTVDGPGIGYDRNEENITWLKEHIQQL